MKEFFNDNATTEIRSVRRTFRADRITPIVCYKAMRRDTGCFLLESMEGNGRTSRYTVIGSDPILRFAHDRGVTELSGPLSPTPTKRQGDPYAHLHQVLRHYSFSETELFLGGFLAGYTSFEAFAHVEKVDLPINRETMLPEFLYMLPGVVIRFDNYLHTMDVVVHGAADKYAEHDLEQRLAQTVNLLKAEHAGLDRIDHSGSEGPFSSTSSVTEDQFTAMVDKARDYIRNGDIFQVVLSRRKELNRPVDPLESYRRLRMVNPSPYMYLIEFGDSAILGASPETMVKYDCEEIMMRPIAGTRPRGKDAAEDQELADDLQKDPKEIAEHDMLVDLGRNDIGRVAVTGTVRVPEYRKIEHFSHVMHLVSTVTGKKRPGLSTIDIFKACFPAGTVSGAPKIRAVEIISELENSWRGPYAGAIGYFDFHGRMDTCIAIRTLIVEGEKAWWQAGAGIVADSVPANEFKETENKGRVLGEIIAGAK